MNSELPLPVNCLRCGAKCRTGKPDPKARELVQATKSGHCPNCMITIFLHGIEPIRETIWGTEKRPGLGPEIFLDAKWRENVLRPVLAGVLAHTQMPEDSIDWIEVVGNWTMPLPNVKEHPTPLARASVERGVEVGVTGKHGEQSG